MNITAAFLTFLILITGPTTFLLFWLPFYLYRLFLILIVQIFKRKELKRLYPLDSISSILSVDRIYTEPGINICVSSTLEESFLTKDHIIQIFHQNLILARNENNELKFPQLQQKIVEWMGISWWTPIKNFRVRNHVYFIEDQSTNPVSMSDYLNKPFRKGGSPWDILIVCNTTDKSINGVGPYKYDIKYRFHHVMHDGYSVTQALSQLFTSKYNYYMPASENHCWYQKIIYPPRCVYEFIKSELRIVQKTALDPENYTNEKFEITTCPTIEIPFSLVLEIKQKFNVCSTSVLLASFAGGIRSWLDRNGYSLPNYIKTSVPVMIHKNRKQGLSNQFSQVVLFLPVKQQSSMLRLFEIDKSFMEAKNSTYPITSYYLTVGLGKLINPILRYILNNRPWPPFTVSCVVGPKEKIQSHGVFIENVNVSMACRKYGVLLSIFSYNQSYQMNITANQNVIPTSNLLEELKNDITNEFLNLKNSSTRDFIVKM